MTLRWRLLATALTLSTALSAGGERSTGAARTVLPLQALGLGARPFGMGAAFVAVKDDLQCMHFNPAGMAFLSGDHLSLQHNGWVAGIRQDSMSLGVASPALVSGLTLDWVDYGPVERTDSQGMNLGTFSPMDYGLTLAVARRWGQAGFGLAVRGVQQSIDAAGQMVLNADLGLDWSSTELPVTLGVAYSGLGTGFSGDPSTGVLRGGLAFDLAAGDPSGLLIALEGLGENNGVSQVQMGLEGRLIDFFFVRAGYQVNLVDPALGGGTGVTCGGGAKVRGLVLDYAYLPFGILGHNHRIGLSYHFAPAALAEPVAPLRPVLQPAPRAVAAPSPQPGPTAQPVQAPQPERIVEAAPAAPAAPGPGPTVDMVFEVPEQDENGQFRQWLLKEPADVEALRKLGAWYYKQGDKTRAIMTFERVLELQPSDLALQEWLKKARHP